MSKSFLSFLGTSRYTPCNYFYNDKKVTNVTFIQKALIEIFCSDFKNEDKIIIFLTKKAKEDNWKDSPKNNDCGLKKIFGKMDISAIIKTVDIPEGYSESEIWEIFKIIFKNLEEEDQIILDITHGFRSLPMLNMVMLNYAKFLKKIEIIGIYYGAFEVLGPSYIVQDKPMEERNAPIFDLTKFAELQDWSVAVDNFVNYGITKKLHDLIIKQVQPTLKSTEGKDDFAQKMKYIAILLHRLYLNFSTVRGMEITKGEIYKKLKETLKEIKKNNIKIQPFIPIIEEIEHKINHFIENDIYNGFKAAEWCFQHDLIQQGITLIQENILSLLLTKAEMTTDNINIREVASSLLHVISEKIPQSDWKKILKNNKDIVNKLKKCKNIKYFAKVYNLLRNYRNDINHGGFVNNLPAEKFKQQLKKTINKLKEYNL